MKLMSFVYIIFAIFHTVHAERYYIYSESYDSFAVDIETNGSEVEITSICLTPEIDLQKICGRHEQPFGPFSNRRVRSFNVKFKDGYIPLPGEEPFILFHNDFGDFRIIFFDEKYIELQSSSVLEVHDDASRRETDLKCCEYDGLVRHWILFGPYMAIYSHNCYGSYPAKSIYICDAPLDKSWIQSFKERDIDWHVKAGLQFIYLREQPPRPKPRVRDFFSEIDIPSCPAPHGRWWSRIFRCDDCDDPDTED
jgi:hypothetical protein